MASPLLDSPLEMAFVERDQEIQTLSAQAAAKSLADSIGFRRPHRRSPNGNTQFLHGPVELLGEDTVSVVDRIGTHFLLAVPHGTVAGSTPRSDEP